MLQKQFLNIMLAEFRLNKYKKKNKNLFVNSLQCRHILGWRNLVRVRNIVVAAIFDFMTVEDWGE